jgi:hypothetical protein
LAVSCAPSARPRPPCRMSRIAPAHSTLADPRGALAIRRAARAGRRPPFRMSRIAPAHSTLADPRGALAIRRAARAGRRPRHARRRQQHDQDCSQDEMTEHGACLLAIPRAHSCAWGGLPFNR